MKASTIAAAIAVPDASRKAMSRVPSLAGCG
jgi:hypothetical protein